MGTPVDANGRSVLHKGHGKTHSSAVPDVCKTPTPGGPVPIPYPNFAMDSNLVDGAESVQIEGNPVAHVKSKISTSFGDEPGTVGGIMSNVNKGTCTWKMGSADVKAEGESVVRFLDTTYHNGNSFNTVFLGQGGIGMGYGDDFDGLCPVCQNPPLDHAIRSTGSTAYLCAQLIERLRDAYFAERKVHKGSRKKPTGYMVGVMVCQHATNEGRTKANTFAAMSGNTLPAFMDLVNSWSQATPIGGDFVQPEELIEANTAGVDQGVLAQNVINRFAQVMYLDLQANQFMKDAGFTPYGSCAASKLLARSGHGPIQMTEAYFNPPGNTTPPPLGPYWMRVNGVLVGQRTWNATDAQIPSCNTCQATLFMTMCPVRVCVQRPVASA